MATVVMNIQNLATTTTHVPQRHCDKGTVWHNGTETGIHTCLAVIQYQPPRQPFTVPTQLTAYHLVARVRICEAIPSLPHIPSRRRVPFCTCPMMVMSQNRVYTRTVVIRAMHSSSLKDEELHG